MKTKKQLETCVFYFFNEYELKKKKTQKINNIVQIDFYLQNELTNQQKLNKIKDRNKHFYLCENTSQLQITQIDEDDTKIQNKTFKTDDTCLLQFQDRNLIFFKNYLKALSSSKKYLLTIINSYKHLLNSIQLLVSRNIFHNNINFDTIVVDKSENILLSNFSFSINYLHADIQQYIKQFIIAYEPAYLEWPIEFHLLSYLLTNKLNSLSSYNIESIIMEYIQLNNILNTFGSSLVSLYKDEALKYFKKYVNQTYGYILTDMLQYAHTWDNYALSILYLRILIGLHSSIGVKNKFIILFMKLLVNNINLNPCIRFSIDVTINNFDILLDSLEPKDYKEVINNLIFA